MATQDWELMSAKLDRNINLPDDIGLIEEKLPEIMKIADDVIEISKDGFQFRDIVKFFSVVGPLMELSKSISGWDEAKKEDFIVDAVYLIYQTIDTYPDGKQNNIDIPFLFGKIEKIFEKRAVDFATRAAIAAIKTYEKKNS